MGRKGDLMSNRRILELDDGLISEGPSHLAIKILHVQQPALPGRLRGAGWDKGGDEVLKCV